MRTKRLAVTFIAALMATMSAAPFVQAELTKSKVKAQGRKAAKSTQRKWKSLSPEQQQEVKQRGKKAAETATEEWNSLTAEQQAEAKQKAASGAQRTKEAWKNLPP